MIGRLILLPLADLKVRSSWLTGFFETIPAKVICITGIYLDSSRTVRLLIFKRQAVTISLLWEALKDYDMYPIYLLGLTWTIPSTPATNYLTLTLRSLHFNTFTTNLLTIPAYTLFLLQLIFWTWISERINNRFLIVLFCQFWMLPLLIALEVLPGGTAHNWGRYVLNMMLVGFPYVHAIIGRSKCYLSITCLLMHIQLL